VPGVHTWLWVDDGSGPCPDWAVPYEEATRASIDRVVAPWGRDGDQIVMMYTGGTTGLPKGVMWRQRDLANAVLPTLLPHFAEPEADYDAVRASLATPGFGLVPACPLMHATGQFTTFIALCGAGSVTTLGDHGLDVVELLDTVEAHGLQAVTIVGDAFAKPILAELDAHPDRWDLSSLVLMISSGVMWSEPVKQALLGHVPGLMLIDAFSSSEAIGMGQSVSTAADPSGTAKFVLGPRARVISDAGHDVVPGSGEMGRVAIGGYTPIGYYKDPDKSAATFVTIDGATYSMPGDYATVEVDGTLSLLGRGSVVINTGGEKVFPEEVEEVLKAHPGVLDAVTVGVPDETFGEAVTAVVELHPGGQLDEAELIAAVKAHLAGFKAPKRVLQIDTIGRAPNGKVDYKRLKAYAADQLG
jgi:3-oxocholest-4-en-26-oate---CoA ligase